MEHGERSEKAEKDPPTCVVVCLYEHIPIREVSRLDMPRWFSRDDVVLMKDIFSYHLNPNEYERLLGLFPESPQRRRKNKRRKK